MYTHTYIQKIYDTCNTTTCTYVATYYIYIYIYTCHVCVYACVHVCSTHTTWTHIHTNMAFSFPSAYCVDKKISRFGDVILNFGITICVQHTKINMASRCPCWMAHCEISNDLKVSVQQIQDYSMWFVYNNIYSYM
jgi:hypothetical protein